MAIPERSPSMHLGEQTEPPEGFIEFCREMQRLCGPFKAAVNTDNPSNYNHTDMPEDKTAELTLRRWRELSDVNWRINKSVHYVSDTNSVGVVENWFVAQNFGDCEDIALAKQQRLFELGWPPSALSLATVFNHDVGHHAVLLVRTDMGDFVLDNANSTVQPWRASSYAFLKVQSGEDPQVWRTPAFSLNRNEQAEIRTAAR